MKILYHHRTLGVGAEGVHIREMVKAFRSLGHEVLVVGPVGETQGQETVAQKSSRLEKIKSKLPGLIFEIAEIGYTLYGFLDVGRAIRAFHPDFIYDRYITFNAGCIIAGRSARLPVFLEVNSPLALERSSQPDAQLFFKRFAHWTEKWVCSNASKTIVVSTPLSEYLQSIGVPTDKLVIMPNGVDQNTFCPRPKSLELLTHIGAREQDVIVAFTGVIRPWHGLDLLVQSVEKLVKKSLPIFLLIIGDGPIRPDVEKLLVEAGIHHRAKITGIVPHDQVAEYVNLCDIAVSPKATFYASPMKVIEYMGMGKAVIVPNTPNLLDIVDPGVNAEVFAENDSEALTQVLAELCSNHEKRRKLGTHARHKVETRLNWTWNATTVCDMAASLIQVGNTR
jgi:glycosyltransferase involved in cell wall biosynthesis